MVSASGSHRPRSNGPALRAGSSSCYLVYQFGIIPPRHDQDAVGGSSGASYNPGLKRYLLATEHTVSHASVMSLFDAPEPWGPWTTVKYWTPNDRFGQSRPGSQLDWADNVFFFSFAPKWFSTDGRSFTLVFTGGGNGKNNDSLEHSAWDFPIAESLEVMEFT